jgi:hypothetical protein
MHQVLVVVQLVGVAAVALCALCVYLLTCDPKLRIVHGIEHATIKVLEASGVPVPSGQAERGGFVLELPDHVVVGDEEIAAAAASAIARLRAGEAWLAYDRECGTVHGCRFVLPPVAAGAAAWVAEALGLPEPLALVFALGLAVAAYCARRPIGVGLQRVATVSTRFASAIVTGVESRRRAGGLQITVGLRILRDPRSVAG